MRWLILPTRLLSLALGLAIATASGFALVMDARQPSGKTAMTLFLLMGLALALSALLSRRRFALLALPLLAAFLPLLGFGFMLMDHNALSFGARSDPRSKLELIEESRRQGKVSYPAAFPGLFLDDPLTLDKSKVIPLAGAALADTVLCQEADGWARYDSDRFGFNNPDAVWDLGDNVLLLGDSFVHGACQNPGDAFPDILRQAFPATVNLGMSDDGPLLMLATYMEYGDLLKTQAVVWTYYDGNDLYRRDQAGPVRGDLQLEFANPILRGYLDGKGQKLLANALQIDRELKARLETQLEQSSRSRQESDTFAVFLREARILFSFQKTLGLARLLANGSKGAGEERKAARLARDKDGIKEDLERFRDILGLAASRIQAQGAKAYFLYLPSVESFIPPAPSHPLKQRVIEAARQSGYVVIDAEDAFRKEGDVGVYYAFGMRGGHFSRRGNRLVAEILVKALSEKQDEETRP